MATLSEWRRPDDTPTDIGVLPVEEEAEAELSPPDAFDGIEPDEEEFMEATGNAGATFERTYRRAALVVWPRAQRLAVLNQAGLAATMPYIEELTGRWAASGESQDSTLWGQAHELAGHMIVSWPVQRRYSQHSRETSDAARIALTPPTAAPASPPRPGPGGTSTAFQSQNVVVLTPSDGSQLMELFDDRSSNAHCRPWRGWIRRLLQTQT